MSNWHPYNPHPFHKRIGDCTVRAISRATGHDWDTSYLVLCTYGFEMKNMPSGNCVWGALLKNHGFTRCPMAGYPERRCTVEDFCREHPHGLYVLGCDGHVVTAGDGGDWGSWGSGGGGVFFFLER